MSKHLSVDEYIARGNRSQRVSCTFIKSMTQLSQELVRSVAGLTRCSLTMIIDRSISSMALSIMQCPRNGRSDSFYLDGSCATCVS